MNTPQLSATTQYYLSHDGSQMGPYTLSQLRNMWQNGTVTGNMLHWHEGAADWTPLSEITKLLEPPPVPQKVVISKPDIFAEIDKIPKSEGRLTVIGILGIVIGIMFIIFSIIQFTEAKAELDAKLAGGTFILGVIFIVACYRTCRRK